MPPDYMRAYARFVEAIKVAVNDYNSSSGEAPLKFVGPILTPDNKIGEIRIVKNTEPEEDEDSGIGMEPASLSQDRHDVKRTNEFPSLSLMSNFPRLPRRRLTFTVEKDETEPMMIDTSPEAMSMTLAPSQGGLPRCSPRHNRRRQLGGVDSFDCDPSPMVMGSPSTASDPDIRHEASFNRFIRDRSQAPKPNAFVQTQYETAVEAEVTKEDSFIQAEDEVRQDSRTLDVGDPHQEDDANGRSATFDVLSDDDVDNVLSDHCQEDGENGGSATLDALSDGDADNVLSDPDVGNLPSTTEHVGETVVMVIDSDTSSDDSDEDSEHSIYNPSFHNSPSEKGSLLRFRRSTPLSPNFLEEDDAREQQNKAPRPRRASSIDGRSATSRRRTLTQPGPVRRVKVWRPTLWTPIERFTPNQRIEFDGSLRHSIATATRGTNIWNGLFNGSREWDD
ncbi:hypothetical protein CKAH01_11119 [Colletotrichum kahawae]|uniref:Uncharacterized protein n=1 Tax=Colletotrichum kahawae TaxID=34407 RepID=A0AAD9XVV8_COLKA|nr:hypothetical protein CKAH01_11119 [Colletotrichum kahawae]